MRAFVALLLLLEVGMLGTFLALDLVLFFLFFEVVLVPMWFVIALWGDPHDRRAGRRRPPRSSSTRCSARRSCCSGSCVVHAQTGTFDLVALAARGGEGIAGRTQVRRGAGDRRRARGQGADVAAAHLAARRAHGGADGRLGAAGRRAAEDGHVRAGPRRRSGRARRRCRGVAPVLGVLGRRRHRLRRAGLPGPARPQAADRVLQSSATWASSLLGIATLTPAGLNGALFANIAHGVITGLLFFLAGAIKDRHGTSDFDELGGGLYARPAAARRPAGLRAPSPRSGCPGWPGSGARCWR